MAVDDGFPGIVVPVVEELILETDILRGPGGPSYFKWQGLGHVQDIQLCRIQLQGSGPDARVVIIIVPEDDLTGDHDHRFRVDLGQFIQVREVIPVEPDLEDFIGGVPQVNEYQFSVVSYTGYPTR